MTAGKVAGMGPDAADLIATLPLAEHRRRLIALDLLLRGVQRARSAFPDDSLETILVLLTIGAANGRPYFINPPPDGQLLPEDDRRLISRRAVAEATGLPRETVRRIIAQLVADGRVEEAEGGGSQ